MGAEVGVLGAILGLRPVLRRVVEDRLQTIELVAGDVGTIVEYDPDRVLPVDTETARHIARLGEQVHRQPIGLPDIIIAATAIRHGLILLTRNMSELGRLGIAARDPFVDLPPDV